MKTGGEDNFHFAGLMWWRRRSTQYPLLEGRGLFLSTSANILPRPFHHCHHHERWHHNHQLYLSSGQLWLRRVWWQQMDLQLTGFVIIVASFTRISMTSSCHHITGIAIIFIIRCTSTCIGQIPEPTPSLSQTTRSNFSQVFDRYLKIGIMTKWINIVVMVMLIA